MKLNITGQLVEEHRLILRMLDQLEQRALRTARGEFREYGFYLDAVDFIRNYADRFHHAKEEDVLFTALVENGMPRENSPVAAMLMEHDLGRAFVKGMEEAANKALAGDGDQDGVIADNAIGYLTLLRNHIAKEDGILYPLAEKVLPEAVRPGITERYAVAEAAAPAGFEERYRRMVEQAELG